MVDFTEQELAFIRVCRKVGSGTVKVFVKHGIPAVAKTNFYLIGREDYPPFWDEYRKVCDAFTEIGWGELQVHLQAGKPSVEKGERHWMLDK
jgi:hypothetical protein